jgi:hypothetical protein
MNFCSYFPRFLSTLGDVLYKRLHIMHLSVGEFHESGTKKAALLLM